MLENAGVRNNSSLELHNRDCRDSARVAISSCARKKGANTSKLLDELQAFSEQLGDGDRVQDWIAGAGKVAKDGSNDSTCIRSIGGDHCSRRSYDNDECPCHIRQ